MGTPAKRRKLNESSSSKGKASPAPAKTLDFFFGKQQQHTPASHAADALKDNKESLAEGTELSDEQLARKLQTEWDNEIEERNGAPSSKAESLQAEEENESIASADIHIKGKEKEDQGCGKLTVDSIPNVAPPTSKPDGTKTLSLQSMGTAEDTITSSIPFDESPLTFEPSKYISELKRHWESEGGNASYALLTACFVMVNSTQSRIKIVDTLVNLLRVIIEGDPSSLLPVVCIIIISQILNTFLSALSSCSTR